MRPRFSPGPAARARGEVGQDLRHPDGRWFNVADCWAWHAARKKGLADGTLVIPPVVVKPLRARRWTVSDLLDDFFASDDFNVTRDEDEEAYSERTKKDYRTKALAIRFKPTPLKGRKHDARREIEEFADAPAAAHDAAAVKAFFLYLRKHRGLAMARGAVMVLSAAYAWARLDLRWRFLINNPCHDLRLGKPAPDVGIFELAEYAELCAAADELGEIGVRFAMPLALFTGQRPSDVLRYTGYGLQDGAVRLVQGKRGKHIDAPAVSVLVHEIKQLQQVRSERGWNCAELVVDERTGEAFKPGEFEARFSMVRAHACERLRAAGTHDGRMMADALAEKPFKYFRKTIYTWLNRADATLSQTAAVVGHDMKSAAAMGAHYLVMDRGLAAAGIAKLEAWLATQGVKHK